MPGTLSLPDLDALDSAALKAMILAQHETLTQSAWAATNRKGSRLQSRYHALKARCGNKRAIVALGHTLLKTVHLVLSSGTPYREAPFGEATERQEQRAKYHLRCLRKLGYPTLAAE